jgi:predicted RNase H-like nuclease (RuvC/YqgF family)
MRRGTIQTNFVNIVAIALLIASAAYGQSLGDVARKNREKKAQSASAEQPKVITNQDLAKPTDSSPEASETKPAASTNTGNNFAARRAAQKHLAEQRAAAQWKKQIVEQESKMNALQARINQLNASIHSAGGGVQTDGPYNYYRARQVERMSQLQEELDEQKRSFGELQEAARRAGMHTVVYDP